jgi:hypothetical protein
MAHLPRCKAANSKKLIWNLLKQVAFVMLLVACSLRGGVSVMAGFATRLATELAAHEAPRLVSDEASSATSHATLGATLGATPSEAPNHYPFKG